MIITLPQQIILYVFFGILCLLGIVIYIETKMRDNTFRFIDLLIDPITKLASITRTSQMVGVITATFIVVYQVVTKQLSSEVFTTYMLALGASSGFSQWVNTKYKDKVVSDDTTK